MDKYTQKIKAVKDLQEEYDRRSEIEEQAFALLAEGKFKEAQELIDSIDDKKAFEMLKEPIEEYGEEQTKKDVYCVMQHIRAFNYQSSKGEKDDFALACSVCFMQGKCDFMVWSALERLEKVDKLYIKCAIKQVEEYRNQDGRKASRTLACTNCKQVQRCDLYMPCAILERIETILLRNMFRGAEVKEKGIPKNPQFKLSHKL